MNRLARGVLGVWGVSSWVAGAVATFTGGNGSGAVALIAAGIAATILALIGQWPSRVVLSGNELSWGDALVGVDQQIEAAADAGESTAVRELEDLRQRLSEAQRTGSLPMHPAAAYDEAVHATLRRLLPGAMILAAPGRARDVGDFEVALGDSRLLVETKYKTDARHPFAGSTLRPLLERVGERDRLLIVTNSVRSEAADQLLKDAVGGRAKVVSWQGPNDDTAMQAAISALLVSGN